MKILNHENFQKLNNTEQNFQILNVQYLLKILNPKFPNTEQY